MTFIADKILDIFGGIFSWIYETLVAPFTSLKSLKDLVFGKDGEGGDLLFHTFTASDANNIYIPGMQVTMFLAAFIVLISIVLAGMRISGTSFNPANRTYFIEFIKDAAIVGLVLANLGTLYSIIFQFNGIVVDIFSSSYDANLDSFQKDLDDDFSEIVGRIIINLALLGLAIWANFYYMMRKLTLLMLMILGPLALALFLNPKTKALTGAWLKELTGTVFVQAVHAFVFWLVASMAISQEGLIESVILYIIFIPVSEGLRSLIGLGGDMNGRFAKAGAMFGMAGLAGVYGAAKGALKDQSISGALKNAYEGTKGKLGRGNGEVEDNKNTLGANAGTDTASTSVAEKMLKAGQITSKMGKAFTGMAGSIAGSTMGPMGAIGLATIGGEIGDKLGGATGRLGVAGLQAVGDRLKKGYKGASASVDKLGLDADTDESLKNAIAEDDTTAWAKGNEKSVIEDLKSRFPDATDQDIKDMWHNKKDEMRQGFREAAGGKLEKLKDASGKFANANQLASQTADDLTQEWAKHNQADFMSNYEKQHPPKENMTDNERLDYNNKKAEAWNDKLSDQSKTFGDLTRSTASSMMEGRLNPFIDKDAFAEKVGEQATEIIKGDIKGQIGKSQATQLAGKTAEDLTQAWANNNKVAFMNAYSEKNPLRDNMSDNERSEYENDKDQAWNNTVATKRKQFGELTKSTADSMLASGVNPIAETNTFAQQVGEKATQMVKGQIKSQNPQMSDEEVEIQFAKTNGNNKSLYVDTAKNAGNEAATQLAGKTAEDLTQAWANNNKAAFMNAYSEKNPLRDNMSDNERSEYENDKDQAWNNTVATKRKQFGELTKSTADSMLASGVNPIAETNTFAQQVGEKATQMVKGQIKSQNPQMSDEEVEIQFANSNGNNKSLYMDVAKTSAINIGAPDISDEMVEIQFTKTHGNNKSVYVDTAKNAGNEAESLQLMNGKKVNRDFVTSQLAGMRTDTDSKNAFFSSKKAEGMSDDQIHIQWKQERGNQYQENLSIANEAVPKTISPTASLGTHAKVPFKAISGFAMGASGAQTLLNFSKEVGQGIGAGYQQVVTSNESSMNPVFKQLEGVGGATVGGFKAIKSMVTENPVLKQSSLNNAMGYTGGVVAGVTGYQVGSKLSSRFNPYNNAVNNTISEPTEVMQMAQTVVGENGAERLAQGAVRMVTTADQSFIEVRTKTGQTRTVSRTGRGDSSMKNGEVVYQDLQVENGAFVIQKPKGVDTSTYKVDSAGGKIPVVSNVNVNPNKLLANRNTTKNTYVPKNVQAYNQQVDSGQFYMNDLKQSGMENVQLIIERDRSYMQASTPTGEKVRVSAYQKGDARIPEGKTVTKNCVIKGQKITADSIVEEEYQDFTTSIDPEEYIQPRPNKRFDTRKQQEVLRKRQSLAGWNG
ncbi:MULTISPECIES: type IV secretion system protein [Metabacillus]|uniref:type IV secretion system protein n=1 Tax=Metabacillus TaxID=2675233 RepID=UPI0015884C13|nr:MULTISPECIES: type IV secretion system protein [Metabacillus]MCM3443614.1 type IV secretion system protein [Metabacillus halosaccharovorans]